MPTLNPVTTQPPGSRWRLPATAMKAATLRLLPAVRPGITHSCCRGRVFFQLQSQSSIKACQAADKHIVNCRCRYCCTIAGNAKKRGRWMYIEKTLSRYRAKKIIVQWKCICYTWVYFMLFTFQYNYYLNTYYYFECIRNI